MQGLSTTNKIHSLTSAAERAAKRPVPKATCYRRSPNLNRGPRTNGNTGVGAAPATLRLDLASEAPPMSTQLWATPLQSAQLSPRSSPSPEPVVAVHLHEVASRLDHPVTVSQQLLAALQCQADLNQQLLVEIRQVTNIEQRLASMEAQLVELKCLVPSPRELSASGATPAVEVSRAVPDLPVSMLNHSGVRSTLPMSAVLPNLATTTSPIPVPISAPGTTLGLPPLSFPGSTGQGSTVGLH